MTNMTNFVECSLLKQFGVYCCTLFALSLFSNLIVICVFIKNKKIMNHVNLLTLYLTILNLIGTLIELPIVAVSAFPCQ